MTEYISERKKQNKLSFYSLEDYKKSTAVISPDMLHLRLVWLLATEMSSHAIRLIHI